MNPGSESQMKEGDKIATSRSFLALQLKFVQGVICVSGRGNFAQLYFPS